MARPTDQETATTEKVVILRSQEKGAHYTTQGHVGKCRCWSGGKGVGGKCDSTYHGAKLKCEVNICGLQ